MSAILDEVLAIVGNDDDDNDLVEGHVAAVVPVPFTHCGRSISGSPPSSSSSSSPRESWKRLIICVCSIVLIGTNSISLPYS
jgi:hypothetical protein